jgi:hypothetical protein
VAALFWLVAIGTSVWVGVDASSLQVKRTGSGFLDMSALGWLFACLLIWIIAFPLYLSKRPEYKRARNGNAGFPQASMTGPLSITGPSARPADAKLDELRKLGELRDAGVLDQTEFATMKASLLRPEDGSEQPSQQRGSPTSGGRGWWKASDERWYPPHTHPGSAAATRTAPAKRFVL